MIQFDSAPSAVASLQALRESGFFCCVSAFPAVPMNKPSIRLTLSRHNSIEDIEALIEQLAAIASATAGAALVCSECSAR